MAADDLLGLLALHMMTQTTSLQQDTSFVAECGVPPLGPRLIRPVFFFLAWAGLSDSGCCARSLQKAKNNKKKLNKCKLRQANRSQKKVKRRLRTSYTAACRFNGH